MSIQLSEIDKLFGLKWLLSLWLSYQYVNISTSVVSENLGNQ